VSAGVLSGNSFEIVSGGEGDSTVTARGADITGTVEQSSESESEPVRLYEAEFEFADTVERSDLTVTANALTNDNGAAISESRLTVTTAGENPVIIGDNQAPAADLNGDGKLEDVNGDGEANFEDGIALAFNIGTASNNAESFDFDGDGDVDFDDAIALVFQV
jgi:PKD repeat protein